MKKRIFAIIFALLLIVFIPVCSHAEFGEFAGDSDYGSDSGGFDFGNDSDYGYDDDDDDDNNYVYEKNEKTTLYYSYIQGTHTDDNGFGGYFDSNGNELTIASIRNEENVDADYSAVLGAIIVGIIAIIVISNKRSKRKTQTFNPIIPKAPVNPGADPTPIDNLKTMSEYTSVDPDFSATELKEKISNMYIQMQNCWQAKNIEQLRPYFTDALFAQYDRQLEHYRKNHETNCVEHIAVLGVEFKGWRTVKENDEIIATVRTRIIDYVIDDKTQQVIRGSKSKEKFMTYEWVLSRKSGVKTTNESGTRTISCPHCGAPVDINKSAKCEYCGSILTVDSSDWVINEIKGISQRTGN